MKNFLSLALLLITSASFAAPAPQTIPNDNLKLGKTSAGNKTIIFENAAGSANPKLRWNNSSARIEYSNDGTNFSGFIAAPSETYQLDNVGISATVSSNQLIVALKGAGGTDPSVSNPVTFGIRPTSLTSGQYTLATVTDTNATITVANGSTLGCTSAVACTIHVYLINNAGTYLLGLSGVTAPYRDNTLISTSAVGAGGGGNADSRDTVYAVSGLAGVAARYIGKIVITEATAGTWASSPTSVELIGAGRNFIPLDRVTIGTRLSCSSSSSVSSDPDNAISAIGNVSGGACTVTIVTGIFSVEPICVGVNNASGNDLIMRVTPSSATSFVVDCATDGGTACTSYTINVICQGVR